MQKDALRGGPSAAFFKSLPISAAERRRVDFVMLFVGSTPLLIPFLAAGIALVDPTIAAADRAQGLLLLAYLLCTQWCAQHAVLDERRHVWLPLLTANLYVAVALGLGDAFGLVLMVPAVLASMGALAIDMPAWRARMPPWLEGPSRRLAHLTDAGQRALPAPARLSLAILYRQHHGAMLGTFFSCMLVTAAALGLMQVWDYDGWSYPMAFIALGAVALSASGLYWPLQLSHEAAQGYMAALPMRPGTRILADTAAVASLCVPFALALSLKLWWNAGISWGAAAAAIASFVLLLATLRIPQLYSRRHAVVMSTVLAAGWTFVAAHTLTN